VLAVARPPIQREIAPAFDGTRFTSDNPVAARPPISPYYKLGASRPASQEGTYPLSDEGPYSVTDPAVHGVVMVADPTGLARPVIKTRTDESKGTTGSSDGSANVRISMVGAQIFSEGDEIWARNELYIPAGFPLVLPSGGSDHWLSFASVYDRSGGWVSTGPMTLQIYSISGANRFHWILHDGLNATPVGVVWTAPATTGVWHVFLRHMKLHSDPAIGFGELWYGQRGAPLTVQTLSGVAAGETRHFTRTCVAGTSNAISSDVTNYHADGMWTGFTDLYHANHKAWRAASIRDVRQVDPYYTGALA
jgi:hypothetical protein